MEKSCFSVTISMSTLVAVHMSGGGMMVNAQVLWSNFEMILHRGDDLDSVYLYTYPYFLGQAL